MNKQYFFEAKDKDIYKSLVSTPTVNNTFIKNNEFLTRLINIFATRIQNYCEEGELFNPEHNKFLLSNTKMLADLIKIQSSTAITKAALKQSTNTINYKDVMNVLHKRK